MPGSDNCHDLLFVARLTPQKWNFFGIESAALNLCPYAQKLITRYRC